MRSRRIHGLIAAGGAQVVVRFGGLSRDYLLASWIGFGPDLDPYFLAFSVLVIAIGVVASIVHIGLVPAYSRGTTELTRKRANRLLVAGAVAVLGGLLLSQVVTGGAVAALMLLAVVPATGSVALSARLVAAERQVAAVLPGLALSLVPIGGALALGRTLVLRQLVAVVLIAYLLELVAVYLASRPLQVAAGVGLRRAFDASVVSGLGGASLITTAWLATDLVFVRALGETSVSIYSLAIRIPQGIAGIVVPAVTNWLLPSASRTVVHVDDFANAWPMIRRAVGIAAAAGGALAVVNLVASFVLRRVAFAGSAVSADQAAEIFTTQGVLGFMLPAYVAGLVVVRYFQAVGHYRPILVIGVATLVVNGAADALLSSLMGVSGIAAATVVAYLFSSSLLYTAGRRIASRGSR